MTDRLRAALERSASQQHRNLHQILFYALCRDLQDLTDLCSASRLQDLKDEYAIAESQALDTFGKGL